MKLYRQNINGWVSIELSGIPKFKFSDVLPTGYVDYDTILQVAEAMGLDNEEPFVKLVEIKGKEYYCDFKFVRDHVKTKFINWVSHSDEEKEVFCYLKIGSHSDRVAFMGVINPGNGLETIMNLTAVYGHKATGVSRNVRAKFVYNEVWNRLSNDDAKNKVANNGKAAFNDYKELGFDGTINGDPEGVYDFIFGIVGTQYQDNGILQQSFDSIEGFASNQEFCDYLNNIVLNGKYLNKNLAKIMGLLK